MKSLRKQRALSPLKFIGIDFQYKPILDGSYPVRTVWTWTNYEDTLADFCRQNIFPYLYENNLVDSAITGMSEIATWFEGYEEYNKEKDDYDYKVQPASDLTYGMWSAKRFNIETAMYELESYKSLVDGDKRKVNSFGKPLVNQNAQKEDLQLIFKHVMPIDRGLRGKHKTPLSRRKNIVNQQVFYFGGEFKYNSKLVE